MPKHIILSIFLISTPFLIYAQTQAGIESRKLKDTCECTPACSPEGVLDCKHGRLATREDCPCCKICLRQNGETCGGIEAPCDKKQGLTCSSKGICEGGPKCNSDLDCADDRFCVKDMCADPCPLLQPCHGDLKGGECVTMGHQPHCQCPKGHVPNHEINACVPLDAISPTPSLVSPPPQVGCKIDGRNLNYGGSFYTKNCEQKCICGPNNRLFCDSYTCPAGLFPVGTSHDQRFCIELRNSPFADECCVVLACASNFLQSIHSPASSQGARQDPLENSRALSPRKIFDYDDVQSISDHDYQQQLEELEQSLNKNVSLLNFSEKRKHDLLDSFSIHEKLNKEPVKSFTVHLDEISSTTQPSPTLEKKIDDVNFPTSTESTTLTTFLLHSHKKQNEIDFNLTKSAESFPGRNEAIQTNATEATTPTSFTETFPTNVTKAIGSSTEASLLISAINEKSIDITETSTAHESTNVSETSSLPKAVTLEITMLLSNDTTETNLETATELVNTIPVTTISPSSFSNEDMLPAATLLPLSNMELDEKIPVTLSPDSEKVTHISPNGETSIGFATTIAPSSNGSTETTNTAVTDEKTDSVIDMLHSSEDMITVTPKQEEKEISAVKIMEVTEDGEPLRNFTFLSEVTQTETFREGKGASGESQHTIPEKDEKPTVQPDKLSLKPGIIHVRRSTHNSTTLYLPSTAGGILHYKESRPDIEASKLTISEGQQEVVVPNLSPNTRYTFKWAGNDGANAKTEAKTEDGCRHKSMSYAVGTKWYEGCQTTCSCHTGGSSECRPRCLFVAGTIQDDQCEEKPSAADPGCCVEYSCKRGDNSVLDSSPSPSSSPSSVEASHVGEPKLIVTSRTHNSVTVAWDDFRADDPGSGYVTEYREVPSVEITAEIPWMKKETIRGQPPPTMTIGNLKPNTNYEVRVGIYSQADDRRLNAATETIKVMTEPGCVYGNTSFPTGEFYQGCEERCLCSKDGSVKCSERCSIPYFRKGSFSNDPFCTEEQADGDNCCVLVMCAHGDSRGVEEDYDQCANTVCGNNAECVSWPTLTEASGNQDVPQPGSCRCKLGFSGDPSDLIKGCTPDPKGISDENSCNFRQKNYSPGDVFFDGCSFKCTCNHQREIECQPRCKFSASEAEEKGDFCYFLPDAADDCCKIRVCNSTAESDLNSSRSPIAFDGCTHGNKTYAKNEKFTSGCDAKCLCMGYGDVSCFPRCPPIKEMSEQEGVICETLLDPEDDCCNVTVCDGIVPDVMKANVSGNATMLGQNVTDLEIEVTTFSSEFEFENVTLSEDAIISMEDEEMANVTTVNKFMNKFDNTTRKPNETEENIFDIKLSGSEQKNLTSNDHKMMTNDTSQMEENPILFDEDHQMENKTLTHFLLHHRDMMSKSENETLEEDATLLEIENKLNMTDVEGNETHVHNGTEPMFSFNFESSTDKMHNEHDDFLQGRSNFENVTDIIMKKPRFENEMGPSIRIDKVEAVDSSIVQMVVHVSQDVLSHLLSSENEKLIVSYSHDSLTWVNRTIPVNDIDVQNMYDLHFLVNDLEEFNAYQFKVYYKDIGSKTMKAQLTSRSSSNLSNVAVAKSGKCEFKGKVYKAGDKFYDDCIHYCKCNNDFQVQCEKIECPARFGLDILDPDCIEWEDDPDYVATPPSCCGNKPRCAVHLSHLSCTHMEKTFQHLDLIPREMVGCDERCQCLSGSLDCEPLCSPVQATPPYHLDCSPIEARLVTLPTFPCCREWQCANDSDIGLVHTLPPGSLPDGHSHTHMTGHPSVLEISLPEIIEKTEDSVRVAFTIPRKFVGLPGGIYIRYTPDIRANPNPLEWASEVIHEDGVTLNQQHFEYLKANLQPGTNYTMQLALSSHLTKSEIISPYFVIFTPVESTTPLPRLDLDAELSVSSIMNTSATVSWKHFTEYELKYIDGIRVRYWPGNKKFPVEGPMLHRKADNMILRNLTPDTKYTVDLFFFPAHESSTTTISNTKNITFTTLPKPKDIYNFNVTIESGKLTKEGVQILYSGVAEPEGKFVNVYRVVYTTDGDSQDSQKFKVPKNQKEGFILLTDLKPGVEYEVWLEAYLTNGGRKKSNVITIKTEPGELPKPAKSEIVEAKELTEPEKGGSYYSAFVAVAILVALACLVILGLVFLLMRRQNHAKAHISAKTNSAYDNPSYKTSESNPNYAIEMNGLKNTTNGNSRGEEP